MGSGEPTGTYEDAPALGSCRTRAFDTGADIAPVGATWAEARQRFPNLELHSADGSHPSPEGSYLAALVIASSLLAEPLETAPDVLIDQETADLLLSLVNG